MRLIAIQLQTLIDEYYRTLNTIDGKNLTRNLPRVHGVKKKLLAI